VAELAPGDAGEVGHNGGVCRGFGEESGERTAQMLDYFVSLFGLAPYANMTVVQTADGAPNGYSAPGLIFLAPRAIAKEVNDNVLANQLARQWWEVNVSPINRNHMWMENGMALYAEGLWAEHDKGASALEQRMRCRGADKARSSGDQNSHCRPIGGASRR